MTLIIGLTGSIATGKSTVSSLIENLNVPIIDADKIAREVVKPGRKAYHNIIKEFGPNILQNDQMLNRQKLGEIIFQNQKKRELLNKIVHPDVREEMQKQRDHYVKLGVKSVVLDIPLLFESKLTSYVHKIIVVFVQKELQLKRLMARDHLTEKEALRRINSQIPISEKIKLADAIIDNNRTKKATSNQVKNILSDWNAI